MIETVQTISKPALPNTVERDATDALSNLQLFVTTGALVLCGSFTYSIYPAPVNAAALGIMVALFYYSLHRQDLLSFCIQLIIGNFFIFGNKYGGNYNLAAFAAIISHVAVNGKITFLKSSVLDNSLKSALLIWVVFDFLSVMGGNHFPVATELQNFFAFCMLLYLFYFISRIQFTVKDIYKIVIAVCIFLCYEFLVALNQKYELFNSPFPFFPKTDNSIVFELDIVRSSSTLNNFEAFAEICVSLIALLVPGILSGSSLKKSKFYYYFSLFSIIIASVCIIYSGTRSSMVLLPFIVIGACIMLGKRLKTKIIVFFISGILAVIFLNTAFNFIDLSVFQQRSESMDFQHLTLDKLLSGEEMNRGDIFSYAKAQVAKSNGIIGRGYFVSPDEYRYAHFAKDSNTFEGIADYHNLYMSAYVMWGAVGLFCLLFLFVSSLVKGAKLYWQHRQHNDFSIDLLLGFNLMFFFFLINQFKIQFIRDINYFTLIMLLLIIFISLARQVEDNLPAADRRLG